MKPWSITMQRKRLTWFSHLRPLPAKAPAWKILKSFINLIKKPSERQKTTWVSQVLKEIKLLTNLPLKDDITKNIEILEVACYDRGDWRSAVSSMMLTRLGKNKCNSSFKTLSWRTWVSFAIFIEDSKFSRNDFNFCTFIGSISFGTSLKIWPLMLLYFIASKILSMAALVGLAFAWCEKFRVCL